MPALNIAEIQTNKENVKVFKTAYTDKLSNYRNDYSDYSFYRFDNEIFAWNLYQTQIKLPQEFNTVVISKKEQTLVFKEILEQGIVHFFISKNQDIYRRKYSSINFNFRPYLIISNLAISYLIPIGSNKH